MDFEVDVLQSIASYESGAIHLNPLEFDLAVHFKNI